MDGKMLICGFEGENNSSKLLLDNLFNMDKLYLKNDFGISPKQLHNVLNENLYDLIIMFGQKPVIKSLYLETTGVSRNDFLVTDFDVFKIKRYLENLRYKVKISNNAGKYLCNNIYYHCLRYIKDNRLNTKAIFIHIPTIKSGFKINEFSSDLIKYIDDNFK